MDLYASLTPRASFCGTCKQWWQFCRRHCLSAAQLARLHWYWRHGASHTLPSAYYALLVISYLFIISVFFYEFYFCSFAALARLSCGDRYFQIWIQSDALDRNLSQKFWAAGNIDSMSNITLWSGASCVFTQHPPVASLGQVWFRLTALLPPGQMYLSACNLCPNIWYKIS